jgi:hypothetical protein
MNSIVSVLTALVLSASVMGLGAGKGAHDEIVLRLPDRDWGIRVAPDGVEFGEPQLADDGSTVWAAGDTTDLSLIVKVMLESSPEIDDDTGCLARREARLGLDSQEVHGIVRSTHAGMPVIEYEIRRHGSVRVDQRNLHAFRFHDGACAEFHLSMMEYKSQNRRQFDHVLNSIELIEIGDDVQAADIEAEP